METFYSIHKEKKRELTYYWSRAPGCFVDKMTGKEFKMLKGGPQFTGTVREWYETLVETIHDMKIKLKKLYTEKNKKKKYTLHRFARRKKAYPISAMITSPDIYTMLELTSFYEPIIGNLEKNTPHDKDYTYSMLPEGRFRSLSMEIYKDPFFPTNRIIVKYGNLIGEIHVLNMNILD